jgi:hypothetical protein
MSISQKSAHQTHEAIVFFSGGEISKEMLYTEFEALLDCVVPMRDFAGREMQAAYVRLDSGLSVVALVLFLVNFDAEGFPEQRWNVPLRMLADAAGRGPDLGGGPVRIATRSQCPLRGYEASLWDVQFGPGGSTLEQLRERLHGNRLGLDAPDVQPLAQAWTQQAPPAQQPWAQAPAAPVATPPPAADAAEAVLNVMQQANTQIAALKEQHQRELMAMQQRLSELQQRHGELQQDLQAQESEKRLLQGQVEENARVLADEQRRAERKVQMLIERTRAQTAALRQELQDERASALAERDREHAAVLAERERRAAETLAERERRMAEEIAGRDSRMQEELARLERERLLHEEQLNGMRAELTELRRDKLRLMDSGADKFFAALKDKGVKFVAFQPGAGHLTIPMEDLFRYIEETTKFVAEKCGVSEEHYQRWLAHYNNPVCQGSAGHGGLCAKPLNKLLKPAEFVSGLHDRCDIHKQVPRSQPRDKSA